MNRHISEQYDLELSLIRDNLMEMGGLVEKQVNQACTAFTQHDLALAEEVRETESRLNQFEVELDDQCVSIIAKRQPTAGDLRAIVSVMKAITDLERIGDEADRIAKMAQGLRGVEIPADQYAELRGMHTMVVSMLHKTLDAFARLDVENALRVIEEDTDVDLTYNSIVRRCTQALQDKPNEIDHYMGIIWVARALERIGDHAKNISEYVIYQVKGQDVRHGGDVDREE